MSLTNQQKNQHLLWRAGFGPAVEQLGDLSRFSPQQYYKALVKASGKKPDYVNVADNYLQGLMMGIDQAGKMQKQDLSAEERKKRQQMSREGIRNLNLYWLKEMVKEGDAVILENDLPDLYEHTAGVFWRDEAQA